jgi:hypothetical protein
MSTKTSSECPHCQCLQKVTQNVLTVDVVNSATDKTLGIKSGYSVDTHPKREFFDPPSPGHFATRPPYLLRRTYRRPSSSSGSCSAVAVSSSAAPTRRDDPPRRLAAATNSPSHYSDCDLPPHRQAERLRLAAATTRPPQTNCHHTDSPVALQ